MSEVDVVADDGEPRAGGLRAARAAARRGRYADAVRLAADACARGECEEADSLDLQARVAAQQGLLIQAESLWMRAMEIDGDDIRFPAALAALRRPRRPYAPWWRAVSSALAVCLAVLVVWFGFAGYGEVKRGAAADARRLAELESTLANLVEEVSVARMESAAAYAALARAGEAEVSLRESTAELRDEFVRWQKDWRRHDRRSRTEIMRAIAEVEQRIGRELAGTAHMRRVNGADTTRGDHSSEEP